MAGRRRAAEPQGRLARGRQKPDARFPAGPARPSLPAGYANTLRAIKERIQEERLRVVMSANAAMVRLCSDIGRTILERHGKAITNFQDTLPPADSDLAAQVPNAPYLFDFLGTADPRRERELEATARDAVTFHPWGDKQSGSGVPPLQRSRDGSATLSTPNERRGHVLFIDARKLGVMVDRTHRELTDEDITRIASTDHAWRDSPAGSRHSREGGNPEPYTDVPGFCKSAAIDEIRKHGHVLTPGRYVGAEAQQDDGEPFEEKMRCLVATLREQQDEAAELDAAIAGNLKELGYGG